MIRPVDINAHADRVDHGETAQADKVLVRGNRVGRECGRSAGKEASPNFRAAGLGAMCLESPPCAPLLSLSPLALLICHLLQSRAPSTPFPRPSLPLSCSLFLACSLRLSFPPSLSRLSLFLSLFLSLILRRAVEESSTQPLRETPRRSRVSARAFRLAVQRTLASFVGVTETFAGLRRSFDQKGIGTRTRRDRIGERPMERAN